MPPPGSIGGSGRRLWAAGPVPYSCAVEVIGPSTGGPPHTRSTKQPPTANGRRETQRNEVQKRRLGKINWAG